MWANLVDTLTTATPRTKWEDSMKVDLMEGKCEDGRLTKLAKESNQVGYLGISW